MIARLPELRSEGWADFTIRDAKEPWVQVGLSDAEYAINFHYPFEQEPAVVLNRHRIKPPPWKLEHFEPQKAATYVVSAPAQIEVVDFVHRLFKHLYALGEVYSLVGRLDG